MTCFVVPSTLLAASNENVAARRRRRGSSGESARTQACPSRSMSSTARSNWVGEAANSAITSALAAAYRVRRSLTLDCAYGDEAAGEMVHTTTIVEIATTQRSSLIGR
jgi:hypothetical protein